MLVTKQGETKWNDETYIFFFQYTVQPVLKATCIKQLPAFKGHNFRSH